MIAIIDYGSGNVGAIANIYKHLKVPHRVTGDLLALEQADRYVLPGVGAFDTTMSYLRQSGMIDVLNEQVLGMRKKVLGICVGMQILANSSEEGESAGLGWVPGHVRKIDISGLADPPHLPHMGWNSISTTSHVSLFDGVDTARGFYFLHSYHFEATSPADVTANVKYGRELACGVVHGNVHGLQFHPEKSHANGIAIFRNFARL